MAEEESGVGSEKFDKFIFFALLVFFVSGCGDVPTTAFEIQEMVFSTPSLDHTMVLVPEGPFVMGAEDGLNDEGPAHQVHLDAFYIDKYEVTNAQFFAYSDALGAQRPTFSTSVAFNQPSQPVVGVIWEQASGYCDWAGLRLPTEAEWEKAARGSEGQAFPWGDNPPSQSLLQYLGEDGPAAVGSFPDGQSPFGAQDMAGNVWEYARDHYIEDFYLFGSDNNPVAVVGDGEPDHTIRGGGWASTRDEVRSTRRWRVFLIETDLPNSQVGFRCAKD